MIGITWNRTKRCPKLRLILLYFATITAVVVVSGSLYIKVMERYAVQDYLELCTIQFGLLQIYSPKDSELGLLARLLIVENMQILLLFTLFTLRRRGQIIECRTPITLLKWCQCVNSQVYYAASAYQIMKCQVAKLRGLDSQVLKSLRTGIDFLVYEFSLNLVTRHHRPP
jgi:hypothetical protein